MMVQVSNSDSGLSRFIHDCGHQVWRKTIAQLIDALFLKIGITLRVVSQDPFFRSNYFSGIVSAHINLDSHTNFFESE